MGTISATLNSGVLGAACTSGVGRRCSTRPKNLDNENGVGRCREGLEGVQAQEGEGEGEKEVTNDDR